MSVHILMQQFLDHCKHIKNFTPQTVQRYRQVIKYFSRLENISEIEDITLENTRHFFYHGRTNINWSVNTFLLYHKSLVVFFRFCEKQGAMQSNFMDEIETPRLEKRLPKKLTKQEAMKILEVTYNYPCYSNFLRYRNYAIFSTLIHCGLRKNELLSLKLTDVDIENMSIFIRQGKGNKDRVIPMNYRVAEALQKYIVVRNKAYKTCPEFFTSYTLDKGFTESGIKKLVAKISKASGIKFTLHKMRHTFATLMLEGGCDIYSLSKMMGHSDIKTTTIYLAASVEHLRDQILKHPLN